MPTILTERLLPFSERPPAGVPHEDSRRWSPRRVASLLAPRGPENRVRIFPTYRCVASFGEAISPDPRRGPAHRRRLGRSPHGASAKMFGLCGVRRARPWQNFACRDRSSPSRMLFDLVLRGACGKFCRRGPSKGERCSHHQQDSESQNCNSDRIVCGEFGPGGGLNNCGETSVGIVRSEFSHGGLPDRASLLRP